MSQENVAAVRGMWEAFLLNDFETALAAFDPDVEWDGRNIPDGVIGRGHEAVLDHARRWAAIWRDWTVEVEDLQEPVPGVVLAFTSTASQSARGDATSSLVQAAPSGL